MSFAQYSPTWQLHCKYKPPRFSLVNMRPAMMTWLAFGGAAFRGAAFAFGALTATSTRTASELDAAPTASTTTVGTFADFAFALALFPARTFLTSFEARNLVLFTYCFLANIFKAMLRISCA